MSRKTFLRSAAVAAAAAVVAGIGLMTMAPAQATVVGGATLSPATGSIDSLISITSSGPCAAPATAVRATAKGFGFPATANGQIVVSPTTIGFSTTGPMTLNLSNSFRIYAQNNGNTPLVGVYDVRIQCVNSLGTVIYNEYQNNMTWTTPGNSFANIDSATYTSAAFVPTVTTTTTLATSVASPQNAGTAINLTATVDGGATDPTSGSVEFFRGATSLGTATVGAGSTATLTGVNLPVGTFQLSAVYAGVSGFDPSTSANVPFTININPTTTTLDAIAPIDTTGSATLTANVTPNNEAGTVQFFNGASAIGTPVAVASGSATRSLSGLAAGTYSITAVFTPTSPNFAPSTSAAQDLVVTAASIALNEQQITARLIDENILTISALEDRKVLIPLTLDATGVRYTGTGELDPVRVIDRRAGSLGWTAYAKLTNFQQGPDVTIAGANLGWTPKFDGTTFSTAPIGRSNADIVVTPGTPVAAPANGLPTSAPLGSWDSATGRTLATGQVGASVGTTDLSADLSLVAPTTTESGDHIAKMTFTVV